MKTIRELTTRVEEAHTRHLQEVKSLEDQTRSVSAKSSPMNGDGQTGVDEEISFETLVQGGGHSTFKNNDNNTRGTGSMTPDMFSDMVSGSPATGISPITATATTTTTSTKTNNYVGGWQSSNNNSGSGRHSPMMATLSPSSGSSSPVRRPAANPMNLTSTLSPMSQPQSTQSTSIDWSSSMNNQKSLSSYNSNQNTIPTISAPTSSLFQSIPSLPPPQQQQAQPPSMATLSLTSSTINNNNNSGNNSYAALRGLSSSTMMSATPTNSSRSSSMELLQPLSTNHSSGQSRTSMQSQSGHKLSNLTAFDPLG